MGAALAAAQAAAAAAYANPETALQYAYQAQLAADGTGALSMQYPFGMVRTLKLTSTYPSRHADVLVLMQGLGSLQLAQMGSLLQAGQPYALLSGAEDAVYVNQKQYHRILKRRQARMKLEAKFKIMPRKVRATPLEPPSPRRRVRAHDRRRRSGFTTQDTSTPRIDSEALEEGF